VLLQACGYNDDGLDRTPEQWDEVFDYLAERDIEVIIDAAYIGLADGYRTDCYPIEQAIKKGLTTFVCVSASKNMGLYGERVGALYIANAGRCNGSEKQQRLKMILDHQITRPTISSPSRMFAQAVAIMLGNNSSRNTYLDELESARNRLQQNREALAESLDDRFPHVTQGKGIFTQIFSEGFTQAEREQLRAEGILALPNSRVNIGGMRTEHVQRVGSAILGVLKNR
jgi:aspartate/tyrosine/aromatic aminotransferase